MFLPLVDVYIIAAKIGTDRSVCELPDISLHPSMRKSDSIIFSSMDSGTVRWTNNSSIDGDGSSRLTAADKAMGVGGLRAYCDIYPEPVCDACSIMVRRRGMAVRFL
ncbi:hypothetical protein AA23498_1669 [Acetobacter nitrogenifigens DSM 23921 = NBRC 105050]|nr:hypothetical protein AA23498_1669 [Acetobacter nitrogenifigens DSM 23921 = NBRC 105050]